MRARAYALMREGEGSRRASHTLKEQGRELAWLIVDGLAVAYTFEPADAAPKSVAQALEHARVIAELHAIETVIPLRYVTGVAGLEQLEALVRSRHSDFLAVLEAVSGCHEFGVRVAPAEPASCGEPAGGPADQSGTAYLLERRGRMETLERQRALVIQAARQYQDALESLAVKSRSQESCTTREKVCLSLDFLVRREQGKAFQKTVAGVPEPAGVCIQVSGPWAPYQFSQDALS